MQIGLEAVAVGLVATAVGSVRGRGDFTGPTASTIVYGLSLASVLALLAAVLRPPISRRTARPFAGPSPPA